MGDRRKSNLPGLTHNFGNDLFSEKKLDKLELKQQTLVPPVTTTNAGRRPNLIFDLD